MADLEGIDTCAEVAVPHRQARANLMTGLIGGMS
jgi:protein-L-isoaspartate(D-aspartate) O-methyltransferase